MLSGGLGPQTLHRGRCLTTEEAVALVQTGGGEEDDACGSSPAEQKQPPWDTSGRYLPLSAARLNQIISFRFTTQRRLASHGLH